MEKKYVKYRKTVIGGSVGIPKTFAEILGLKKNDVLSVTIDKKGMLIFEVIK